MWARLAQDAAKEDSWWPPDSRRTLRGRGPGPEARSGDGGTREGKERVERRWRRRRKRRWRGVEAEVRSGGGDWGRVPSSMPDRNTVEVPPPPPKRRARARASMVEGNGHRGRFERGVRGGGNMRARFAASRSVSDVRSARELLFFCVLCFRPSAAFLRFFTSLAFSMLASSPLRSRFERAIHLLGDSPLHPPRISPLTNTAGTLRCLCLLRISGAHGVAVVELVVIDLDVRDALIAERPGHLAAVRAPTVAEHDDVVLRERRVQFLGHRDYPEAYAMA